MQKTKIEWTDYVWNPIKGLCPVGCWYCYARKIYKRFHMYPELYFDGLIPILSNKESRKIFVCSTIEMFHPNIPKEWRDVIFKIIGMEHNRKHTFQILTKFPQNIDRPMPDNVWLGVTINKADVEGWRRIDHLQRQKAKIKFISFEPLLGRLNAPFAVNCYGINWAIFGRLTGYGKKWDPKKEWIKMITDYFKHEGVRIFLKNNLNEIWGESLIQEFPDEEER